MPQNKTIVKFIPAGLKISNKEFTCFPASSEKESIQYNTENLSPKLTESCNVSKVLTPPKTICKNKSLKKSNIVVNVLNAGAIDKGLKREDLTHLNGSCQIGIVNTLQSNNSKICFESNEVSCDSINQLNNFKDVAQETSTFIKNGKLASQDLKNNDTRPNKVNNRTNFKAILYEQAKFKKSNEMGKQENKHPNSFCQCKTKCDNFVNCLHWCKQNLYFEKIETSRNSVPIFIESTEKKRYITKKVNDKIFLLGPFIPRQVSSLSDTFLEENIRMFLETLNCSTPNILQSHLWLAIQRGLNAIIIAPPKSGKTLSYLAPFCSFCYEKTGRYKELSKYQGPLVIILSHNSENCIQLKELAKVLSQKEDIFVECLTDEFCSELKKCDILITTPPLLEYYLKLGIVKIQKLCHLAIENAYPLLRDYHQHVENLFKMINNLQANRPYNKNIQFVITSQQWFLDLDFLVKKLYTTPLICFTDFLEAAVYSKIQFTKKKLKCHHKILYLNDILKTKYMTHKSIVFCKQEEITKIKEQLEINGIETIVISDYLEEDDIFENENMWNSLQCGYYKVLLCTDSVFERTQVLGADWLIHYFIPCDENQFQKRFRSLGNNFHSPLMNKQGNYNQTQLQCFVIFDETNENLVLHKFFDTLTRNSVSYLKI